jgi:integration host factor subunit beta
MSSAGSALPECKAKTFGLGKCRNSWPVRAISSAMQISQYMGCSKSSEHAKTFEALI